MPDDATGGVTENSSRLQPSNNLHAPVNCSCWQDFGEILRRTNNLFLYGLGIIVLYSKPSGEIEP